MSQRTLSVCIPVYNESNNLPIAITAIEELFVRHLQKYRLEIIVTDNGSTDGTWETLSELAKTRPFLKGFRFSRNFGYQNSIFAGLSLCTGDAAVELDADLEDPPQVILEFVKKWEEGYDVVYGVRSKRAGPLWLRGLIHVFYWFLDKISDMRIPRNSGDFRLLDRKVIRILTALNERNLYLRGLVTYLGFKQTGVTYERVPRQSGSSKFNLIRYFAFALDGMTAFSKFPLRLIGWLGFILFFISVGLGTFYLGLYWMVGVPIQGFTTLVILILGLNSITFMFLGVIGEYLSRIFDDAKSRPRIIIADAIHSDSFPTVL